MTAGPVQIRTFRGVTWLNAGDLTRRLREVAEANAAQAQEYDPEDPVCAGLLGAAQRFAEIADEIDLAIIGYLTEHPGDSPIATPRNDHG